MFARQFRSRFEILEPRALLSHLDLGGMPDVAPNGKGRGQALGDPRSLKRFDRARWFTVEPLESRTVLSAVVSNPNQLWPTNQIPYVIDPTIRDHSEIVEAINEYNDQTTLQWVPWTGQAAYVDFAHTDVVGLDEASVGYQGTGPAYIYERYGKVFGVSSLFPRKVN